MRANKAMEKRKTPKTHQNILVFFKPESKELPQIESLYRKVFVFYKGDPNKIKDDFKSFHYSNIDIPNDGIDDYLENLFNEHE
jgi:hypothetical protein